MDDITAWIIVIGFYAPLHFLLPVLVLFITGREPDDTRRRLIRRALTDAGVSMVVAFVIVIPLTHYGQISLAMSILLLSMAYPFIGIWRQRHEISPST